ncbi:ATP-binding protein involved in chromosome partitioning [Clavibacter sp. B3I6]|uniref:Mrp/NBP35 family ATP-binding protein n=1 Tax=Clavibacter sp. B3I6 TaxID=3042268 RepID=UPI00277E1B22|nr:P-loop NTPase [Clavibacter sp. B3I6]MDQ0743620.1 ATP-binding protein involved in chromosome partitioning [Clavibacter sp. B3I6]
MAAEAPGGAPLTAEAVGRALAGVVDPEIRRPITELDMVSDVRVEDGGVAHVDIALTIVGCPAATSIERDVRAAVRAVPGVAQLELTVGVMSRERRRALTERLRGPAAKRGIPFGPESLTRVYAVTSGKGGVGKSTLTANLAVALAAKGLAVGLVDADVHGFSIPGILGLVDADGRTAQPTRVGDMILPPVAHGVKVISIGMFLDPDATGGTAVSWRGPMLHRTIQQFLTDVFFGDLDVLLLDLPPGTGDVAITVGQLLPDAEVLVVTTPQPAAADVAERSGLVARQTGQRVAGVVENMAGFVQPDGSVLELFGAGGGAEVARRLSAGQDAPVPLLASVPLSVALREGGDSGAPLVLAAPEDPAAVQILRVADHLATRGRGLAGRKLGLSVS